MKPRRPHYRSGDVSLCSTLTSRIRGPLTSNHYYVKCPRCLELLGKKAAAPAKPKPKLALSPKSAGIEQAKHALGLKPATNKDGSVKKKPAKKKKEVAGQMDVWDFVEPLPRSPHA